MKKEKGLFILITLTTSMILSTAALGVSFAVFTNKTNESKGPSGEISLRSYYDSGDGSEGNPFVITRPRHLYNLSRLQGLGVYDDSNNPTYFQLGKLVSGQYKCYPDDVSTAEGDMVPYLNMEDSDYYNNPIFSIGSEALPFYGVFDGKNVEIKNLNVYADPQDVGLFGYTAHKSVVQNLFLTNVTINALGYTNQYNDLYSSDSHIHENVYFEYDGHDTNMWQCDVCEKSYKESETVLVDAVRKCPKNHTITAKGDKTKLHSDYTEPITSNFYYKTVEEAYCPICKEFYTENVYESGGIKYCPVCHTRGDDERLVNSFAFDDNPGAGKTNSEEPSIKIKYPTNGAYSQYDYYPLLSGSMVTKDENDSETIKLNLNDIFYHFYTEIHRSRDEGD